MTAAPASWAQLTCGRSQTVTEPRKSPRSHMALALAPISKTSTVWQLPAHPEKNVACSHADPAHQRYWIYADFIGICHTRIPTSRLGQATFYLVTKMICSTKGSLIVREKKKLQERIKLKVKKQMYSKSLYTRCQYKDEQTKLKSITTINSQDRRCEI